MKLLLILHMPPPVHGAAMVGKYIYDSEFINSKLECRYINLTTAANLEDIGKLGLAKIKSICKLLIKIQRIIKDFEPDLVYYTANACGPAFIKDYILVSLIKQLHCKVLVHYHNKGVSSFQDKFLYNLLYKSFFKNIKVMLLSEHLYYDVSKYVKHDDILICPNGIPPTINYEPSSHKNNSIVRLLFLSNLIVSKGVLVLLDSLQILNNKGYSFVCDFVGGETDEINSVIFENELKVRNLEDKVFYHGRKYGNDKKIFFENADIFVFPTFYSNETFGLVNVEAMEYKLPIITSNIGGIPDVVIDGFNGLVLDASSGSVAVDSLADCISRLIDNPELRVSLGDNGYHLFLEKYTLGAFERSFVNSIMSIII